MTYGRLLECHMIHFNLPTAFTEWAPLAQDRAGWHKLVTKPPFKLCKPFVRQPRGDTRVTPEDKQRLAEQRAAEIAKRRADFNATNNWGDNAVHWQPWHCADPSHGRESLRRPGTCRGGGMKHRHKPNPPPTAS